MPKINMGAARLVTGQRRKLRKPQHRFYLEAKPWEINPIMIAPVLPGETLKNLLMQARVVSSPVKSSVVGAWVEYFYFYVTARQTASSAAFTAAMLDPTAVLATSAAQARTYYNGYGHNWASACLTTIVNEWFREQGEDITYAPALGRGSRALAKVGIEDFGESLIDTTVLPAGGALGADQELQDKARQMYEYQRTMGWSRMTFEDWVATYGVRLDAVEDRERPELVRYVREFTYPTNSVEPTTGVPSAAWSWGINERADKDRFFKEPGFIVGVQIVRPKIYFANQTGNAASMLDRAMHFLPPVMSDDPSTSLKEYATNDGPYGKAAGGFTNGYWVDVRDLFIFGDQYYDALAASTQGASIALPTIAQVKRYATEALGDGLFVGATDALRCIRSDGRVDLSILGDQEDMS